MKLKKGINQYISNEDYHADREYISSSGLKLLLDDPRAFESRYVLNEPESKKESASLDFGSYVHCMILEPHLLDEEFAVYPGSVKRGKSWELFKEENKNKIIITKSQEIEAQKAVSLFNDAQVWIKCPKTDIDRQVNINSFFTEGSAEETLCGTLDGVKVKVRFDYRKEFEKFGSINDIKTTSFCISTKKDIEQVSKKWGYELSAALYVDLVEKITGKKHDFYFCYINTRDCIVQLVKASEQMLNIGRLKYKEALSILKEARETGIYYDKGIMEIDYVE